MKMARRTLLLVVLQIAIAPIVRVDAQDEVETESFGAAVSELLDELYEDPTLDGKIRFYYSATYRGTFHEFGDFD